MLIKFLTYLVELGSFLNKGSEILDIKTKLNCIFLKYATHSFAVVYLKLCQRNTKQRIVQFAILFYCF